MKLRSRGMLRYAVPLAAFWLLSGCTDGNRPIPLSEVETIEIPVADVDNQQNKNIDNPTLEIPTTYPVDDGDVLAFGNCSLSVRATPGHTNGCLTYVTSKQDMAGRKKRRAREGSSFSPQ